MNAGYALLDPSLLAHLPALDKACLHNGKLQPMPADYYRKIPQEVLSVWCSQRGFYCLPTVELIEWLRDQVDGNQELAIEVGAGHGAIGRSLGIKTTDSYQQTQPAIVAYYQLIQQACVFYPEDVEAIDALSAVEKYQPSTVIAGWVTHKWDPTHPDASGNSEGVDEQAIVQYPSVQRYIFIGHQQTHRNKLLLGRAHSTWQFDWLFSRQLNREGNVIWIWKR